MQTSKSYRIEHIKADIQYNITKILSMMENPNIKSAFLSVTRVDISDDISYCKVYVSSLYGLGKCEIAVTSLNSSCGFVRSELAKNLKHHRLRIIPEIHFFADDSIEYGVNMTNKITNINKTSGKNSTCEDKIHYEKTF